MGTGPSSADLVSITRLNPTGQIIETRLPAGVAGGDARSTATAYYTATGTGGCVSAGLAEQICSVGPATQPASGNPLFKTKSESDQCIAAEDNLIEAGHAGIRSIFGDWWVQLFGGGSPGMWLVSFLRRPRSCNDESK